MPDEEFAIAGNIVKNSERHAEVVSHSGIRVPVSLFFISALLNVLLASFLLLRAPDDQKPVNMAIDQTSGVSAVEERGGIAESILKSGINKEKERSNGWSPSINGLPSEKKTIDLAAGDTSFTGSKGTKGENTLLSVQQVFGIKHQGEDFGKLVVNAPVKFDGKSMRWSKKEIAQARDFLERLKSYSDDIGRVRLEASALEQEWFELLRSSRPTAALRPDSKTFSR